MVTRRDQRESEPERWLISLGSGDGDENRSARRDTNRWSGAMSDGPSSWPITRARFPLLLQLRSVGHSVVDLFINVHAGCGTGPYIRPGFVPVAAKWICYGGGRGGWNWFLDFGWGGTALQWCLFICFYIFCRHFFLLVGKVLRFLRIINLSGCK